VDERITARLRRLGGVARRVDLVGRRGDARALTLDVAGGAVVKVARGVYMLPGAPDDAVAAVLNGGRLGCVSAVRAAGLTLLEEPAVPHVSVPRDRGRRPSDGRSSRVAVVHREAGAPRPRPIGVRVMPLRHALARMLVCRPRKEAVVAIDCALQRRLVTVEQVRTALPRTAPSSALTVLDDVDGRSQSPLETLARLALRSAGLRVEAGVLIAMVGHVDLLVEGRVVVELDGYEFHSSRREFEEDRRRDRELTAQRYVVLRFTARDVLGDTRRLVETVRTALAAWPARR